MIKRERTWRGQIVRTCCLSAENAAGKQGQEPSWLKGCCDGWQRPKQPVNRYESGAFGAINYEAAMRDEQIYAGGLVNRCPPIITKMNAARHKKGKKASQARIKQDKLVKAMLKRTGL